MFKNNWLSYISFFICLLGFVACEETVEIPGGSNDVYARVYMPRAVDYPNSIILKMADAEQSFVYGAYFGGYADNNKNIQIQFEINPALVDSFNVRNGSNYSILPEGSYAFTSGAVIKSGALSTEPLHLKINPYGVLTLFEKYILPISINTVSDGVAVHPELRTAYYVVEASLDFSDYPAFDRSDWEILDFSSEEPNEGAENLGTAAAVLDGDYTTFWHTQWAGSTPPPPHHIVVDMGSEKELHGLSFVGRQSDNMGKPENVVVSLSNDGENWTEVGSLVLKDINDEQKYFLSSFEVGRYFKITVTSMFGGSAYTHLAELGAF